MNRIEANEAVWKVFKAGTLYERASAQERKCVAGSKKSLQYQSEMRKQQNVINDVWKQMQWSFLPKPGAWTSTDSAAAQQ
jgi:hypothetical protein